MKPHDLSVLVLDYHSHFGEDHPDCLFEKKQQLRYCEDDFKLPDPGIFYQEAKWEIPELMALKTALNKTKERLDNMEMEGWHKHTRSISNSALILRHLRNTSRADFCTNAWTKFIEMLYSYPLIPKVVSDVYKQKIESELKFNSVHLCEAPGAFICALHHFLVQKMPRLKWNWMATTLSPYFEGNDVIHMINEDKLILGSWVNWTFLKDGTGNLLLQDNIRHFADVEIPNKMLGHRVHVHLVTADGSIDCQPNPGEQEALVAQLHLAEILTALKVLGEGGSFVLKIFTFLECETICHLYLLASTFREVHLFKPVTSKEGNSEVYVICTRFIGREKFKDELGQLLGLIEETEKFTGKTLFPLSSLAPTFLSRLLTAAAFFTEIQISVIQRNLETYPPGPMFYEPIRPRQEAVIGMFMEKFPVGPLPAGNTLFRGMPSARRRQHFLTSHHVDPVEQEVGDTLAATTNRPRQNFGEHLELIRKCIGQQQYKIRIPILNVELEALYNDAPYLKYGKPYKNILSSRFCYSRLLLYRQELRELVISYQKHLTIALLPLNQKHICNQPDNGIKVFELLSRMTGHNFEALKQKTEVVCFHELSKNFLQRTDMDVTQERLLKLLVMLETLDVTNSIFLCEYPLLTRLHVGLIFLLAKVFSKVLILMDTESTFHGIFLFEFKGLLDEWFPYREGVLDDDGPTKETVLDDDGPSKKSILVEDVPIEETVLDDEVTASEYLLGEDVPTEEIVLDDGFAAKETLLDEDVRTRETVLDEDAPTKKSMLGKDVPIRDLLLDLKEGLQNGRKTESWTTPMEIVDMTKLCLSSHWASIFIYNTSNLKSNLNDLIAAVDQSYQSKHSIGPVSRKRKVPFATATKQL